MQVSSAGTTPPAQAQPVPEAKEGPGKEPDNDADNAAAVKSAPAKGVGSAVDTTA